MSRPIHLLLSLHLLAGSAHGQAAPGAAPARDPAAIEHSLLPSGRIAGHPDGGLSLRERMRYWNVPGISIAIVEDFRIVYARGFGVTEFGTTTPVDTATLFQAASISKPVFTTGVLRLVEQGRLSLDEDVNARLTSWRLPESRFTGTRPVTLRHLLTHTGGLSVSGFAGYPPGAPVPSIQQVLAGRPPANSPALVSDTAPGTAWHYSGGGFVLAQLLAMEATGEPFPGLMRRLVLAPAGMAHSTFEQPLSDSAARRAATAHERIETPVRGRYHVYPELAAAGLWTTAPDLARWMIALSRAYQGDRSGPFSPETARRMISPGLVAAQGASDMGMGVFTAGSGDSVSFTHGGRNEGFVATMRMWPALGRGYVVLTNATNTSFLNEIARGFGEIYGLPAPPRTARTGIDVDPATFPSLAGRFVLPGQDPLVFDVETKGGELWFTMLANRRSYRLWPIGPDTFYDVNSAGVVVFERDQGNPAAPARALRFGENAGAPRAVPVP